MQPLQPAQVSNSCSFPFEVCNLLLGKGGSGQVFLGRVDGSNKYVAIKKRYIKYDTKNAKGTASSTKVTFPSQKVAQQKKCCDPQNSALPSANVGELLHYDQGDTEASDGDMPLPQRREYDIGEESVTQVAALAQQGGKNSGDSNSDSAAHPPQASFLMDEVSILQYLGPHPHIVRFLGDYTTSRNVSFFTMELMDSDVARELKEGNVSLQRETVCVAMAYSVLTALEYMHTRGVAHRDVKPGNILLKKLSDKEDLPCLDAFSQGSPSTSSTASSTNEENCANGKCQVSYVRAALGDFSAAHGVVRVDETAFADTRGTLHYKSPEQLMGKRGTVSGDFTAVDLWGLGCTMYEMVTSCRPFPGNSELQVLMSILDVMGSDVQSFPRTTKPSSLFQNLPVSADFVDLLNHLLCLDASARCSASAALQHPLFSVMRAGDFASKRAKKTPPDEPQLHITGIPLTLYYAPCTYVPQLRFSKIARNAGKETSLTPELSFTADVPAMRSAASMIATGATALAPACRQQRTSENDVQTSAMARRGAATATTVSEPEDGEGNNGANLTHADDTQQRSPDTTGMSFMSESSYLHWSEIRPMTRPSALQGAPPQQPLTTAASEYRGRESGSSRAAVALFSSISGNSPSPAISYLQRQEQQQQRHSGESARHPSASTYCNTVARALNISDSSMKAPRTEGSGSHVEFDLSPVDATQLFATEKGTSTCAVPNAGRTSLSHSLLPVLQLANGSTFTASNLRANFSFEHEGHTISAIAGNAVTRTSTGSVVVPNHCNTPRQSTGPSATATATATAGRALCFSEETDAYARRSLHSSASQQSCFNSLLTSPAPVSRVAHESSSPHPSPIRPLVAVATSSSSAVPNHDGSGLSPDDSTAGLAWIGTIPFMEVAAASAGEVAASGQDLEAEQRQQAASLTTAPLLSAAHTETQRSSCDAVARVRSSSSLPLSLSRPLNSPLVLCRASRVLQRGPAGQPHALTANFIAADVENLTDRERHGHNDDQTDNMQKKSDNKSAARRVSQLPLPIPLSVAAVHKSPKPSRNLHAAPSCTPAEVPLPETPHTQRFASATSAPTRHMSERRRHHGFRSGGGRRVSPNDSATATTSPSSSSQCTRWAEHGSPQFLQSREMNVPPLSPGHVSEMSHQPKHQQQTSGKSAVTAPAPATWTTAYPPSCPRSQRHCTPSSTDPSREFVGKLSETPERFADHVARSSAVRSTERSCFKRSREEESAVEAPQQPQDGVRFTLPS